MLMVGLEGRRGLQPWWPGEDGWGSAAIQAPLLAP